MGRKEDIADVLVIGAGASGGAFTWSLSMAGIKVVCLTKETGSHWTPTQPTNQTVNYTGRPTSILIPIFVAYNKITPLMKRILLSPR